jgi:hypothetical protein
VQICYIPSKVFRTAIICQRDIKAILQEVDRWHTGCLARIAEHLSIVGRGVLVNAVLSAKLVYFMSLYLLPKWVIRAIDSKEKVHVAWTQVG